MSHRIDTPCEDQLEAADAPQTLQFERRTGERHIVSGRVTALRRSLDPAASPSPVCSLQLQDMADDGLSATCDIPLEPDEPLAIFFPPHGPERGFDLYGRVMRCEAGPRNYAIAIRFHDQRAA